MEETENPGAKSEESSLSSMFSKCLDLWEKVDKSELASVSDEFQEIVKKGIIMLETVTRLVNEAALFSSNETIDEIATGHLKFMLLPGLLGYFNTKLHFQTTIHRMDQLLLAEEYYKDYLKRCRSYELPDVIIPEINDCEDLKRKESEQENTPPMNMRTMALERQAAISNYKKTREMEKRLDTIKSDLPDMDESSVREYYLFLLKFWAYRGIKELHSIETEKCILQSMLQQPPRTKNTQPKPPPFRSSKPLIIVRTELQKKVFGAGYPSLPTMTVDEFYAQRYPADKEHQTPSTSMNSLQQRAEDPEAANKAKEQDEIEEEAKVENDDPEALQKKRAFDDWKDDNRRGCGNRMNMG